MSSGSPLVAMWNSDFAPPGWVTPAFFDACSAGYRPLNSMWDDKVRAWLVAETPSYYVHIIPMIFNSRITLTTKDGTQQEYEHAWCFPDRVQAAVAIEFWDPATQSDIPKCIKRATPFPRALTDI